MMQHKYLRLAFVVAAIAVMASAKAQWPSQRSVLADHEWYKIGVTADGVYGLDYAALQSFGIDPSQLRPEKIRLFSNVQGVLPESNDVERFDDLTEAAIVVTGAADGSFDEGDQILFYGQGPVNMGISAGSYYRYDRNPYTDTTFYFLCVDSEVDGLRVGEQVSADPGDGAPVIDLFLDYYCHESEELSPYASGRVWYGDLITGQDGYKEFQMTLPDMVVDRGLRVESKVLGRCKPKAYYNLKVNNVSLVASHLLDKYQEREYGKEHGINKLAHPTTNHITLRYDFDPFEGNPMLFIDYFVLSYWRHLRFSGDELGFRVIPSQLVVTPARVKVTGAGDSVTCWDITDPIHPVSQAFEIQADSLFFGIGDGNERRYRLFDVNGVGQVASCRRIPNQNLHGLNDAELLIVTPRVFWEQAQGFAAFHVENDAMDCEVADVAEIYNEFGTGACDPTAIRDFIRMLYLRSNGNLKYVLLLGKGTHDYRCIKGIDNNFVPTYESATKAYLEVESICSDDYFALMDEGEGNNCEGRVDLGVGRIPITTPQQGDAVLAKIMHYSDPDATHGLWKNNHLLMADNDTKKYAENAEELGRILDTAWSEVTQKKLYFDSYPVVSTPSGNRIPMANQLLHEYFDQGIGVLSYTGHGGVKSLSAEWVLALSDVLSMTNYDKLPFIHTATCEFSKFDNPGVVSAGELLLLQPQGGAIALLTTLRPTIAQNNQKLSRSLSEHFYDVVDNQHYRFGDVYKNVKSDAKFYSMTNLVYVLFGDPALRMSYPNRKVVTEDVQGSETLTVTGYVADPDGVIDAQFNGLLELRLYDQPSSYTTLGQYDAPVSYAYHNDVLFEGKASVRDGRFEVVVPVPSAVNLGNGNARLVYSAYDSIRKVEACGAFTDLRVQAPTEVVDNQGPDIKLYWNTPDFVSGSIGSPSGVLYADLSDEHGIYHYNVSIGRDIVMNSTIDELDNLVLNDRFEPAVDDYRKGRIVIPLNELEDGVYEFSLKAWDTWNNSSEVSIVLLIERSVLIAEVRSYPNPFKDGVDFSFVNGQLTEDLTVGLEIFDMMGRRVAALQEETSAVSGVVPPIHWNGRSSNGGELPHGVYLYRLTVTDEEGKSKSVSQILVKE